MHLIWMRNHSEINGWNELWCSHDSIVTLAWLSQTGSQISNGQNDLILLPFGNYGILLCFWEGCYITKHQCCASNSKSKKYLIV